MKKPVVLLKILTALAVGAMMTGCAGLASSVASSPEQESQKHLEKGNAYYEKGDYQQAKDDYVKAIKYNSQNVEAAVGMANTAYRMENYEAAGIAISIAGAIDAGSFDKFDRDMYLKVANTAFDKKDYNSAIFFYTLTIKKDPEKATSEIYRKRGHAYRESAKLEEANKDFLKAIEYFPVISDTDMAANVERSEALFGAAMTMFYMAASYPRQKEQLLDVCRNYLDEAIRSNPDNQNAYAFRSAYYSEVKQDYAKALADDIEIIRLDPQNTEVKARIEEYKQKLLDRSKYTLIPSDFDPAKYERMDLFQAVSISEKMLAGTGSFQDQMAGEVLSQMNMGGTGVRANIQYFASDVVFVSQNGTDIRFKTADNAISQDMKINSRSGLKAGQNVRVYYRIEKNPLTVWQVVAIETL